MKILFFPENEDGDLKDAITASLMESSSPAVGKKSGTSENFENSKAKEDRSLVDSASGRALIDKTPKQARDLIANMAGILNNSANVEIKSNRSTRVVFVILQITQQTPVRFSWMRLRHMLMLLELENFKGGNMILIRILIIQDGGPPEPQSVAETSRSMKQFQQDTNSSIKNLEMQMSQLATAVGRVEA
ncbi:hypothetical protein ACS0TY_017649 [Phlomoides rotata]